MIFPLFFSLFGPVGAEFGATERGPKERKRLLGGTFSSHSLVYENCQPLGPMEPRLPSVTPMESFLASVLAGFSESALRFRLKTRLRTYHIRAATDRQFPVEIDRPKPGQPVAPVDRQRMKWDRM